MTIETNGNVGSGGKAAVDLDNTSVDMSQIFPDAEQKKDKGNLSTLTEEEKKDLKAKQTTKVEENSTSNNESESSSEVEEYTQDESGNLLDSEGNIAAKDGEYTIEEDGSISFTGEALNPFEDVITLATEKGFNFKDESGQIITFENTPEGTFNFATAVGEQMIDDYETKLLKTYPVISDIVNHIKAGGNLQDFYKSKTTTVDYTKTSLIEDNVAQQKSILKDYFTNVANLPEEDALENIELYGDSGKLAEKAKVALERLKKHQITKQLEKQESDKLAIKEKQDKFDKYVNTVESIIEKGTLGNLTLPEKDKDAFLRFKFETNQNGTTEAVRKYKELDLDKKLLIDYLLFKDMSLEDLVKLQVNKTTSNNLKKRRAILKPKTGAKKVIKSTPVVAEDFTVDKLT